MKPERSAIKEKMFDVRSVIMQNKTTQGTSSKFANSIFSKGSRGYFYLNLHIIN